MIRKNLPDGYSLIPFSKKFYFEKGITKMGDIQGGIHLIPYCIPDIVIQDENGKIVAVFDAKYKKNEQSSREDSLQIMTYALMTGANKCGFIFPGDISQVKQMHNGDCLNIAAAANPDLNYYELLLA